MRCIRTLTTAPVVTQKVHDVAETSLHTKTINQMRTHTKQHLCNIAALIVRDHSTTTLHCLHDALQWRDHIGWVDRSGAVAPADDVGVGSGAENCHTPEARTVPWQYAVVAQQHCGACCKPACKAAVRRAGDVCPVVAGVVAVEQSEGKHGFEDAARFIVDGGVADLTKSG